MAASVAVEALADVDVPPDAPGRHSVRYPHEARWARRTWIAAPPRAAVRTSTFAGNSAEMVASDASSSSTSWPGRGAVHDHRTAAHARAAAWIACSTSVETVVGEPAMDSML